MIRILNILVIFAFAKSNSGLIARFFEGIFYALFDTTVVFLRSQQWEALSKDLADGGGRRSLFGLTLKTCSK
jgi:hypothetical protein